ncbi:hypothetical protein OROHE_009979 [Orobanche hederae]
MLSTQAPLTDDEGQLRHRRFISPGVSVMRLPGLCSLGECELSSSPPFLNTRGVGKWILKQMQEFFETDSEKDDLTKKEIKTREQSDICHKRILLLMLYLSHSSGGRRTE